jgi:hypothetical protein
MPDFLCQKRRKTTKNVAYADNFFLPFNLLAAKTFLPPAVFILARKPCTLDLCLFLGWNVIFISYTPPQHIRKHQINYIRKPFKVKENLKSEEKTDKNFIVSHTFGKKLSSLCG